MNSVFDEKTGKLILSKGKPSKVFIIDQAKKTYSPIELESTNEPTIYKMIMTGDSLWVATGSGLYSSYNYNTEPLRLEVI